MARPPGGTNFVPDASPCGAYQGGIQRALVAASGTQTGPFQGVPATGKSVTFGAHYTFRFAGGKIVERWSTIDRVALLVQIGALALPAAK